MEVRTDTTGEADAIRNHLEERNQEATNHGLAEIEQYAEATMPIKNFEMIGVLGDILCCRFDDCNGDGTEVERDGIWFNIDVTKAMWRSAEVLMIGPNVSPRLKPGMRVAFPNDKGIKTIQFNESGGKQNIIFINEERIFGILAPKK